MVHPGIGFFTPENQAAGVTRHLWFVVSDPSKNNRVVIANVSTTKCTSGEECLISPGEHDKVSRDSYLRFDYVTVTDRTGLETSITQGLVQVTTDASQSLLQKLRQAILKSRAVPREAQEILRAQ